MKWYGLRPRDPAGPRWPLPRTPQVDLKASGLEDTCRRFGAAFPSEPFGTPGQLLPHRGVGSFHGNAETLSIEKIGTPSTSEE